MPTVAIRAYVSDVNKTEFLRPRLRPRPLLTRHKTKNKTKITRPWSRFSHLGLGLWSWSCIRPGLISLVRLVRLVSLVKPRLRITNNVGLAALQ